MDCKICGLIIRGESQQLLGHIKCLHPMENEYTCIHKKCMRKFVTVSSLKKHVRICTFNLGSTSNVNNTHHDIVSNSPSETFGYLQSCSTDAQSNAIESPKSLETGIHESILKFIGNLYSESSIAKSTDQLSETVNDVLQEVKQKVQKVLPIEFHVQVKDCFDVSFLRDLNTEYNRICYLKKCNHFISPESFIIGEMSNNKIENGKSVRSTFNIFD
jgi:hypothetical protein